MTALLLLFACADIDVIPYHFDGPVAAAVLEGGAGAFTDATGYVANSRSGTIVPLDLKEGRLLTDDGAASFLRASALPTGRSRILSEVAVVGDAETGAVVVWAADAVFQQILMVPYVSAVEDGEPVEPEPVATEPVFVDADGSGDSPTLTDVTLRAGYTTTETWSIEHDGSRWWAKGSRSGKQTNEPVSGRTYRSDDGELEFVLTGTATSGDRFDLATDTGILEIDAGGSVLGLQVAGDRVYASVSSGVVRAFDALTGDVVGDVALPAGAQPSRMAAAEDGRLFVADGAQAVAWVLRFDLETDPGLVSIESIEVAAPLVDLAWQAGEDAFGESFEHLFVAPVATLRVDVIDLATGLAVDPNLSTTDPDGVFLGAPVTGLASSVGSVRLQAEDAWGAVPRVPTVVVATSDGFAFQLDASTGCVVTDARGPHAPVPAFDANTSYAVLDDQGETSSTTLWVDEVTGEQVIGSGCGGVTRAETWTVTYDGAALSWEVEGTLSGVQVNRAQEDVRYLSDDGSISFLLSPGTLPATDGDRFSFTMDAGLLAWGGTDNDADGVVDLAWEFPGRPVGYSITAGPTGGGWDPVNRKEYALLPVINSDLSARLDLDSGEAETYWQ